MANPYGFAIVAPLWLQGIWEGERGTPCDRAAVKIGDMNLRWGGGCDAGGRHQPLHHSKHHQPFNAHDPIAGSLSDLSISDFVRHGPEGEAVAMESGPQYVRNVKTTKARATGTE